MRSAQSAAKLDLGFGRERLLLAQSDLSLHRMDLARARVVQDQLLERVAALPSVERFGLSTLLPLQGNFNTRNIYVDERPAAAPEGALTAGFAAVTPGFIAALGQQLLGGRDFTAQDDTTSPRVAIVNRVLADAIWPSQDPVGRRFRLHVDSMPVEVVGVMNNAQYILLGEQPRFMAYYPLRQHPARQTFAVVKTKVQDPSAVTADLRRVFSEIDPKILVYGVRTMALHLDQGIALFFVNIGATLATAIGILGLLQTIVGLYGVLAYSVAQRSREFGIRLALGAAAGDVIRGVLRQGSVLVGVGLALGGVLAFGLSRALGSLLVGVSPTDALAYGGSVLIVGLLAMLSSFLPAWRASRVSPASAMRME
jgi:predicted permease